MSYIQYGKICPYTYAYVLYPISYILYPISYILYPIWVNMSYILYPYTYAMSYIPPPHATLCFPQAAPCGDPKWWPLHEIGWGAVG